MIKALYPMRTLVILATFILLFSSIGAQTSYKPSADIDELFEQSVDVTNFPEDDCERSYMMGMQDAKDFFPQGLWSLVGAGSCMLSVCGPAWAGYLGVRSELPTPIVPEGMNEACYLHGFDMSIVEMRTKNIAIGTTVGLVTSIAVIVAIEVMINNCGI
mgnify:FL=1